MKLLDLPIDIINILPNYFKSIHDLYNVLLTCRALYTAYCDSDIRLPPILPTLHAQPLFPPHPYLLLIGVARQIGDWAVSSAANRHELSQILLLGYDGLLLLVRRVTRVSLSDLRHFHATKYAVLNPLTRLVDFEGGPAMVRFQELDPDEYGLSICEYPELALMNYLVYCELFHHSIDAILEESRRAREDPRPELSPRPLREATRLRFIAYCMRDIESDPHSGRSDEWQLVDNIAMWNSHAIRRRDKVLRRYWDTGVLQVVPSDETLPGLEGDRSPSAVDERGAMFILAATHLGYDSLKILLFNGLSDGKLEVRLEDVKTKVKSISDASIDLHTSSRRTEREAGKESRLKDEHFGAEWHNWTGLEEDCCQVIVTNN